MKRPPRRLFQVVDKRRIKNNCTKTFVRFFFERVGAKKEAKASRNSVLRNFSQPQICFAEFAKEEKDLFQIRESLREFAAV